MHRLFQRFLALVSSRAATSISRKVYEERRRQLETTTRPALALPAPESAQEENDTPHYIVTKRCPFSNKLLMTIIVDGQPFATSIINHAELGSYIAGLQKIQAEIERHAIQAA